MRVGTGFAGDHSQKCYWRGAYVAGREGSACALEVMNALGADPKRIGDNLITRGIDLGQLAPGDRLHIGAVALVRSDHEHRPCATFRERTSDRAFRLAARGYRGVLFIVERGGVIRVGDAIRIATPT